MNIQNNLDTQKFTLTPIGLENIPLMSIPGITWQYKSTKDVYICELILKKALITACENDFKKNHQIKNTIDEPQIKLRPEPTNIAYYYNHDDRERIVVLSNEHIKTTLLNIFQQILIKIQTLQPNKVLEFCKQELESRIFSKQKQKLELTLNQEKSYMRKVFEHRYGAHFKDKNNIKNIKTIDNDIIPERIRNKMQMISTIKYLKALNNILHITKPNENNLSNIFQMKEPINIVEIIEEINRELIKNKYTSTLDCGCGTNGPEFFKNFKNISYTGMDLINTPKVQSENPEFKLYRSDFEQPAKAIRQNRYSLILAINSLETTTRPWRALKVVEKMLQPNGLSVLIFNQYEGSFLSTGNPFTLQDLLHYSSSKLEPIAGEVFIALDSPTRKDYLVILRRKSKEVQYDSNIKPKLTFRDEPQLKLGQAIASIEFN